MDAAPYDAAVQCLADALKALLLHGCPSGKTALHRLIGIDPVHEYRIDAEIKRDLERQQALRGSSQFVVSRQFLPPKKVLDARARWGYKEWLESSIRFYEKENFDAIRFKNDFMRLSADERLLLMTKVHKELGRYPDWYLEEKKKGAK